jgi:UDP-3-O-[3-hydroxymyristoyl] N-acetylglucosamine deacetylase/3-hydroxyacyl-[acyl-carrier-protein] dehydratase
LARPQRTLATERELSGAGLHEGVPATLRVRPAPPGHGVVFVRADLPGRPRIPARVSQLVEGDRRTALGGEGGAQVHTVEHLLAACLGLQVDNLEVVLSGPECPAMDGSARAFCELLLEAGIEDQDAERAVLAPKAPVTVSPRPGVTVAAFPASRPGLSLSYGLDYGAGYPGAQHFGLRVTPESFAREVAPARTFCLEREAQALKAQGLGKGATHENTLVIGPEGVVGNTLRFADEFARHKALDLLGDLFLLGADLDAHVSAWRSGHEANQALVRALLEGAAPAAAPTPAAAASTGLSHAQIRRILPHRYPFLLVDRVLEVQGFRRAVGVKNVSVNEPFFQGHYPGEPIMPGVLILEAMAQLAGILLLRKLELSGRVPVLLSIDRVKFRRAVVPGDQVRLEAETLRLSGARGRVQCRSSVGGEPVAEARLNFALTEPPSA